MKESVRGGSRDNDSVSILILVFAIIVEVGGVGEVYGTGVRPIGLRSVSGWNYLNNER